MSDIRFTSLLINAERRPASTGATFEVHSPHTGALASVAAAASLDDCRAAIEAAQRAFPAWEESPYNTRRQILLRASATLESKEWQKKAAALMRAEVAMPESQVTFNLFAASTVLVDELKGDIFPSFVPGGQVFVQRRALGVVCVLYNYSSSPLRRLNVADWNRRYSVVPRNTPILLMIVSVAIPLICSNTVVVRPSEYCPYSSSLVVEALHDVRTLT